MDIRYLASVRIPNEKASGLAIMRQCEGFAMLGHTVTLVRPQRRNHLPDDAFQYYGIAPSFSIETMRSFNFIEGLGHVGFYATRLSQMFASFFHIVRHRHDTNLIYARDPWLLVLPVLFLRHTPMVWEAHQKQSGFFINFVARRVHRVICISEGLRKYYAATTGRTDIMIEPSGVNIDQFSQVPAQNLVRAQLGIPVEKFVVGYVGKYLTMGEEKGVDELITAVSMARETTPELHLLIAGLEPAEITLVQKVCQTAGLPLDACTLVPLVQKDFALYLQAADVLIMNYPNTEHYRHFMSPTKLFAYMASGKVVIASDLPSVREIADETVVFFVPPGDITALATTIKHATIKHPQCIEMATRAKERVNKFAWQARSRRVLDDLDLHSL